MVIVSGLRHLPPWMKNQHGLNEEKALIGKKMYFNWVLVMWHVWLVWILTTKHKSLERVENFERYVIFSCYYLLIYSTQTVFILLCLLIIRFILQMVLLWGYLSFLFVPHWTLIVHLSLNDVILQVFEKMPRFLFCGMYLCFHTLLTTEGVIISFDLH